MNIIRKKFFVTLAIIFGLSFASLSYASTPTITELEAKILELQQQIAKILVILQNRDLLNANSDNISISVCKRCSDGTECSKTNDLEQTCHCADNTNVDGIASATVTGYYRKCALTPVGHCNKCEDGTVCGQLNSNRQICACEKTGKEGIYTGCQLSLRKICKLCDDGTECSQANTLGQNCKCVAPWGSNNAASPYSTFCKLSQSDKCAKCADGTECGQFNWKRELCTCEKTGTEGVYTECNLHGEATGEKICKRCDDGTECGQANSLGQNCKCGAPWGINNVVNGYQTYCRLGQTDKCRACADGTACGSLNSKDSVCLCEKTDTQGVYTDCQIFSGTLCKGCEGAIECGKTNSLGQTCKCKAPWDDSNAASKYYSSCGLSQ
jgi:hypothetical protein